MTSTLSTIPDRGKGRQGVSPGRLQLLLVLCTIKRLWRIHIAASVNRRVCNSRLYSNASCMDPSPHHDPPILHLSTFYLSFYVYSPFFLFFFFFFFFFFSFQAFSSRGRLGQMSSKNRVSASQAASLAAPFGVPRRKGIVSEGGPEGRGRRLLATRQKKK